jgi:hypothetical protein
MSNKARNWEAVHVNRALLTGQASSVVEAIANWFVLTYFGVDLSNPMVKGSMWIGRNKGN